VFFMSDELSHQAAYEVRRQARGAEPPPKERKWLRRLVVIGGSVLSLSMLSVGVWIWYSVTHVRCVSAQVNAGVREVSPKVSGDVAELYVKEDDKVTEGQLLARLDDAVPEAALETAQADLAIRESELKGAQAAAAVAKAQLDAAKSNLEMRKAELTQEIRQAQAQEREAAARLADLKKGAREQDVKSAEARLEAATALLELNQLEVQQSEELVQEGIDSAHVLAVRKTQLATQKTLVRQAELELERLKAGPRQEEIRASEQVLAARQAGLDLTEVGQKEVDSLGYQVAIREAEVAAAEAAVAQAAAQVDRAGKEVDGRQTDVDYCRLHSPVTGEVTRCYQKPGEFARQGVPTILVQEEGYGYTIDAYVRQQDVWLVQTGQPARVKIMTGHRPWIDGTVTSISAHTASQDQNPNSQATSTAQVSPIWVKIRLDQDQLPEGIRHGMLAKGVIKVR
jgi:multidrug resistance efflux pump